MPEFNIDAALRGSSVWSHLRDDPWGLCRFFMDSGFRYAAISRWVSDREAGQDTVRLGLGVPDNVPWYNDTPAQDIDAYADWVEKEARRLVDAAALPVRGWSLYVGTTDSDIAIYFDLPNED